MDKINMCYGAFFKVISSLKKDSINDWQLHHRLMNIEHIPFGNVGDALSVTTQLNASNPFQQINDFRNCTKTKKLPIQGTKAAKNFFEKFLLPNEHNKVLDYTKTQILPYLKVDGTFARAIIELLLMASDSSVPSMAQFYIDDTPTIATTKKSIIETRSDFSSASLLTGLFYYIVRECSDNTVGNPKDDDGNPTGTQIRSWEANVNIPNGNEIKRVITLDGNVFPALEESGGKAKKGVRTDNGKKKDADAIDSSLALTARVNICVLTSATQPADKEKLQNIVQRIIGSLDWVKKFNGTNINFVFGDNDNYSEINKYVGESDFLLVLAENITLIPSWVIGIAAYKGIETFVFLSDITNVQTMAKVPKITLHKVSNIHKWACYNPAINDMNRAIHKIHSNYSYTNSNFYDFWFPADTAEIYIVASPADEKVQDAHLASRNYAFMDNLGDRDAILEIVKLLSRFYPNAHISIMETEKFPSGSLRNNIVVIGGPGGSEYVSFDGTVIDDEGNKICKMFTQKIKSHISYTKDCEFMNVDGTTYSAEYDADGFMNSDYGYFASIVNPINPNNRVILMHGIHTLGVVGAAMAFSTNIKSEMNYRLLHKTITESKAKNIEFEAFFRVDVFNGQAFCPTISQENVFLLDRYSE
jgi:hypothetical protein